MPNGGNKPRSTLPHTAAELRDVAAHARRLAKEILDQDAAARLIAFAEEKETRAAALEPSVQTVSHSDAAAVQRSDPDARRSER